MTKLTIAYITDLAALDLGTIQICLVVSHITLKASRTVSQNSKNTHQAASRTQLANTIFVTVVFLHASLTFEAVSASQAIIRAGPAYLIE